MTILDRLAAHAKERTEQKKRLLPPSEIRRQALSLPKDKFIFENALKKNGLSFICECKKASPSKGLIAPDYPYEKIAREYEAAGADCISVLTEPKWFCGNHEAAENTAIICSLLGSCKERGVNPREWLNDVISKLPYYLAPKSDRDLKELLPDVWRK